MIALVTDAFGGKGGIAQYNRDLLAALAASGEFERITTLTRNGVAGEDAPDRLTQLPPHPDKLAYATAAAQSALSAKRLDVVFCGHLYMAPLAAALARARGAALWLQLHGVEAWERPSQQRLLAAEASTLVTSVSRFTRERFLSWARIAPERVKVLPNTVSDAFAPGQAPARARYDLEGRRAIITVGRIAAAERYKGHDRVIAAMPKILAARPDVVYLIVGDGDDRPRLAALAEASPARAAIRFLGEMSGEDLVGLYLLADAMVMPSTGEGFGIVYLEAMASGAPAIGFAEGGASDALGDGALGVVASEAGLAEAVCAVLASPKQRWQDLASRTRARFGRPAFEAGVRSILSALDDLTQRRAA